MDLIGILSDAEIVQIEYLHKRKKSHALTTYVEKIVLPRLPLPENQLKLDYQYNVIENTPCNERDNTEFYEDSQIKHYTLLICLKTCIGGETVINTGTKVSIYQGGSAVFYETKHAQKYQPVVHGKKLVLVFSVYCIDADKCINVQTQDACPYTLPTSWLFNFPKCNLSEIAHMSASDFKLVYEYFLRTLSASEEKRVIPLAKKLGFVAPKSHYFMPLRDVKQWNSFLNRDSLLFLTEKIDFFNTVNADKLDVTKFIAVKKVSDNQLSWTIYLNNGTLWVDGNRCVTQCDKVEHTNIMHRYIEMILGYRKIDLVMKTVKQPEYTLEEVNYQLHTLNYYYTDILDELSSYEPCNPDFTFKYTDGWKDVVMSFNLVYGFI